MQTFSEQAFLADTVAIAQQIVLVTSVQKHFAWKSLLTAAESAVVYNKFASAENPIESSSETTLFDTIGDNLINGQEPSMTNMSASLLGPEFGVSPLSFPRAFSGNPFC